jgi:hypothetical protein
MRPLRLIYPPLLFFCFHSAHAVPATTSGSSEEENGGEKCYESGREVRCPGKCYESGHEVRCPEVKIVPLVIIMTLFGGCVYLVVDVEC